MEKEDLSGHRRSGSIINNVLKPFLVQKHTSIRIYKTLARPMLCYGNEAWAIRKCDESRITACEMKFVWDLMGSEEERRGVKRT
jgi:hypothetical protein